MTQTNTRHKDTNKFLQDKDADAKVFVRKNRFTGESVQLTAEEAKKHDEIFTYEMLATADDKLHGYGASRHWNIVRKNLNWFRKNNAEAYMILLD